MPGKELGKSLGKMTIQAESTEIRLELPHHEADLLVNKLLKGLTVTSRNSHVGLISLARCVGLDFGIELSLSGRFRR